MLKWFKKLTNRLFGEEIEEEVSQEDDHEIEHLPEQVEERPEFRFPIITDKEIYGWEEDDVEEVYGERERVKTTEPIDDFEPVPLHQNERWPEENRRVTRSKGKQSFSNENESTGFFKREETAKESNHFNKNEQLQADLKTIQSKKRTQRFTPSTVPSPIYGYTKPEVDHYEKSRAKSESSIQKEINEFGLSDVDQQIIDKPSAETFPDEVITDEHVEVSADDLLVSEDIQRVGDQEIMDESIGEMVDNSEEVVTDENIEVSSDDLSVFEDVNELSENVERKTSNVTEEVSQVEKSRVVEENEDDLQTVHLAEADVEQAELPEVVQEENELEEPVQTIEEESFEKVQIADDSLEIEEEQSSEEKQMPTEQIEKNDERIVPFNVLMLKSDKRKLQAREFATKIANEMKAKEKKAAQSNVEKSTIEEPIKAIPVIDAVEQEEKNEEVVQEILVEENKEADRYAHYALPAIDYLMPPESKIEDTDWLLSQSEKLEESLSHFGVQATVVDAVQGPTVTRFELTVEQGTKVSRVRNLTDDLKLTLAARDIRIEAPIPGTSSIGIEIPNRKTRAVRISEVIQTDAFKRSESPLEAVLGLGLTGEPITLDLRKMPHGLIAGATGSGKSVCINSILVSLLYKASPADLQMMLIDPKMVELAPFNGIPHLISPVITDVKAATAALKWAVAEMDRRYELLAHTGVRDIERYNKQMTDNRQFSLKMPYLLIVIDELADLMMMAPADVEVSISRIAQKARACGIHLIIATQRPSVDVITGIIKANIPTRIAFSVSSQVDSRTMIDMNGAERLLGKGDMLYVGSGESVPVRLQGTFVTDDEIERIIEHVQNEASPTYLFGQDELLKSAKEEEEDPLFVAACEFIYKQNSASTSMLQRNFSIGYNRAAKLMDRLEELSFISPQQGSRARDVYLTEAELNKLTETIS